MWQCIKIMRSATDQQRYHKELGELPYIRLHFNPVEL